MGEAEDGTRLSSLRSNLYKLASSTLGILAARKLAQYDGAVNVPATICAVTDAIRRAEQILTEIDRRWPVK